MRHVSIFALLGLGVAGCIGGDDDFGIPAPGVDASVPGVDSSIPVTDTGTPDNTVPDTSVDSALPDTALPDTTPPPVTLTVLKGGAPESGVTIVFGDATGASLGTATTDATGTVSKELVAGSMITAIFGSGTAYQLVTVVGVEPGDALTAVDTTSPPPIANFSIDAFPASPPAGTTQYYAYAGDCQGNAGQPPLLLSVYPECQLGGKFPLVLQAWNDSNTLVGTSITRGLAVNPGDGGLNEAGLASISLSGPWATAAPTTTLRAFGFPASATSNHVVFSEIADGVSFPQFENLDLTDPDAGSINQFSVTPGLADHFQSEVNILQFNGDQQGSAIATRGAVPIDGGMGNIDLGQLLPLLATATVDSTDEVRPTVTWVDDNDGAISGTDGTIVSFGFSNQTIGGTWTFVVPPTATSVRAPEIPAASAVLTPDAGVGFANVPIVAVVEGSFIANYAQLRAVFASLPATSYPNGSTMVPPLPTDGTLRVSAYSFSGD